MSKIYINAMQVERTEKDGLRKVIKSHREWRHFEQLIQDCLREQGHEVIVQVYHPDIPEDAQGAQFKIYAHVTARDEAGDLYYKDMHLPELFTLDQQGWGADDSRMQQAPAFDFVHAEQARTFCQELSTRFIQSGQSKHEQPPIDTTIDLPADYLFVPLQRPNDYVNVHHSPITVVDFIQLMGHWATEHQRMLVIKAHPGNRSDPEVLAALNTVAKANPYLRVINANIHELVRRSKGVITINSGVGFESLIHGKPVAVFGRCDYQWVCQRAVPENSQEVFAYFDRFDTESLLQQYQFLYYYYHHHAYSLHPSVLERSKQRLAHYLASVIPAGVTL